MRQFSLTENSDTLSVFGKTGDGKTSLARAVCGLEKYEGRFSFDGKDILDNADIFALLPDYCLMPKRTVRDNLEFSLNLRNVDASTIKRRVGETIDEFGLTDFQNTKVSKLDAKLKARTGLAKVGLRKADIAVLDNPLSPFDGQERGYYVKKLKEKLQNNFKFVLFTSSDYKEAEYMSDSIAVLTAGVIDQFASARQIYDNPLSVRVASVSRDDKPQFAFTRLRRGESGWFAKYFTNEIFIPDDGRTLLSPLYLDKEVLISRLDTTNGDKWFLFDAQTEKTIFA